MDAQLNLEEDIILDCSTIFYNYLTLTESRYSLMAHSSRIEIILFYKSSKVREGLSGITLLENPVC